MKGKSSQQFAEPEFAVLAGRTVAVTRTREGMSQLGEQLQGLGADVVHIPLIRFAPAQDQQAVRQALLAIPPDSWLVLTSPQAAKTLCEQWNDLGLGLRRLAGLKLAVVGPSTAQALARYGLRADFLSSRSGARYLGEELPSQPGTPVLHLTSQLAEGELQQVLNRRGLEYQRLELYRTEAAELADDERRALSEAEVITLASGSAARYLAALTSEAFNPLRWPVAVMGPQTAQTAQALGFQTIIMAAEPSVAALTEAVRAYLTSRPC